MKPGSGIISARWWLTLNALLDAKADRLCAAGQYERTQGRQDTAGSYGRSLHTVAGEVNLKVPKPLVSFSMPPVAAAWLLDISSIFIGIRVNMKVLRGGDLSSAHTSAKFLKASKLIGNIFWLFSFFILFSLKTTRQRDTTASRPWDPAAPSDEIMVVHLCALSTNSRSLSLIVALRSSGLEVEHCVDLTFHCHDIFTSSFWTKLHPTSVVPSTRARQRHLRE